MGVAVFFEGLFLMAGEKVRSWDCARQAVWPHRITQPEELFLKAIHVTQERPLQYYTRKMRLRVSQLE
jgi:hypothetical protein